MQSKREQGRQAANTAAGAGFGPVVAAPRSDRIGGLRARTDVLITLAAAGEAVRRMHRLRQLSPALHLRGDVTLDPVTTDVLRLLDDLIHFVVQKSLPKDRLTP